MNLLDENFPDDQRDLLQKFGVAARQVASTSLRASKRWLASKLLCEYRIHMSVMIAENSASAIWQRTIESKQSCLDRAAARALLQLKFSRADLRRADDLAAKARAGSLSDTEERELEDYRAVGTALEFLKSKARLALKRSAR